jgi:sulfate-transporting ATPase
VFETIVQFAVLGLGVGSVYALMSLGIVLVYRASGVLNFASGGICALGAYGFYQLTTVIGVNRWSALLITVAGCGVIGALIQVLVMSRLRTASTLTKLIAALGVLTLIQGIIIVCWGSDPLFAPSILPTTSFKITSQVTIGVDRIWLLGLATVLTVVLWQIYSRTRFGRSTSAVAENRRAAASLGCSTNFVEIVNWSVGGALAGLAGVLVAPIVGLDPSTLILLIIPVLAAALVGGFASFSLTLFGALLIGVLQSEASNYLSPHLTGAATALPVLVIVLVIVAGGRARPARTDLSTRLPSVGSGRVPPVLAIVGTAVGLALITSGWSGAPSAVSATAIVAILIISVVVVTGYAGQVSLGQWALAGMGAWIAARLVAAAHFPFWLAAVCGILGAVPVGLVIALPALRTRGVNLAVATLGLALVVQAMVLNSGPLTGGVDGTDVGVPSLFGVSLDANQHPETFAVFAMACLVLVSLMAANLRRGRTGRRLLAVRSNERAAASVGIGVYGAKLYAFGLGSAIAAVAGILTAFQTPIVVFSQFDSFGSINAILWCVIGGVGWVSGSTAGAMFAAGSVGAWLLEKAVGSSLDKWLLIIGGVAVILTLVSAPDGMAGHYSAQSAAVRRWLLRRRSGSTPPVKSRSVPRRPAARQIATRPRETFTDFEASGLEVRYGGVVALRDVSFQVRAGEILGLIGPNGAGKTTLLDAATGFTRPTAGSLMLNGRSIASWSPVRRARAGVSRSFQAVELFDDLSVRENLLAAAEPSGAASYFTDLVHPGRMPTSALLEEVVNEFELTDYLDRLPSSLPQGIRRLVGIARSIMTAPHILFLDEPAAGLDEHETERLGEQIQRLARDRNIGVVLVEHDVPLVLRISDRVMVLDFGRVIAHGLPDEIRTDPDVIRAYLGEQHEVITASAEQLSG